MEPKKQEYKIQGNIGLFDDERTLEKLNDMGNPLDRLSGHINTLRCKFRLAPAVTPMRKSERKK